MITLSCKDILATIAYWSIQHAPRSCPPNLEVVLRILAIRLKTTYPRQIALEKVEFNRFDMNYLLENQFLTIEHVKTWDIALGPLMDDILQSLFSEEEDYANRHSR